MGGILDSLTGPFCSSTGVITSPPFCCWTKRAAAMWQLQPEVYYRRCNNIVSYKLIWIRRTCMLCCRQSCLS